MSVARAAADRFALERVLFIPSSRPPHRRDGPFASYEDRFRMVSLACEGIEKFEASRIEAGPGISYSIETIRRVEADFGMRPLYFLIGADAFAEIRTWHRSAEVVAAVTFIVVSRPGALYEIPAEARVERLEDLNLAVSSSEIRCELSQGQISSDLPAAVAGYILEYRLYQVDKRARFLQTPERQ